ncbi:general negative regulator of transcription subunit 4 isoform X1 [Lactuca sativa]|uniref:general negative regulator of transcription subunit 4 isoform X1 n=1 Tax=Lactuca sativa TaxID=4236 RepID=UPI000CD97888|nr:general negative regulator of transcription subunit 4 isoform X1 [Lactuca sativa]
MSDEGEKTCPLCAEEMDLTDQQLRPCKCGYEICVWCWHHIIDMAEKDNTEGRCPACRTPYNKEKIVGTASKCERLVTGMSVEKKQKSQKGKTKTSEGRKQLGSVRVVQRNLVYIVGLPLNLADEDLLQQKEYFGQYGKVLKVSISRTAAGAIQQFANSTCSVYITYSKEEEAIRSIQSAHGYILEGRTLRACFGTTKYCHAWLRNMPCTSADCLYLHEFGPEEDSFTKDEIITAYTRNRVQQITGVTNDMQRRSGNLLPPPPADDYSNNNTDTTSAWEKPINKTTTTTNQNPVNGMKVPLPNSSSGKSTALPAAASWGTRASNRQPSFKELVEEKGSLGNNPVSIKEDVDKNISDKFSNPSDISRNYSNPVPDEERIINNLSFDMSLSSINNNQRLQACESEPLTSNEAENTTVLVSDLQKKVAISVAEVDHMMSFNDERLRDTEVIHNLPPISSPPNNPMGCYPLHARVSGNGGVDPPSSHLANNNNIPITVNDYSSTVIGNSSSSRELSNGHSYFHGSTEGCKSEIGALDLGESSIISNILSMDFDPWDESLTSPRYLAKFLDKQPESHSHRVLSSRNSNQSRFSFARQDEGSDNGDFGFEYKNSNSCDFVNNNSIYIDKKNSNYNNNNNNKGSNGFSSFSFEESENFATNNFPMSENKISVSRTQVSVSAPPPPPGFSGVSISRAPPPGFTSQERMEQKQTFDTPTPTLSLSGNHMLLRNSPVNIGGDLEFMDPAILAVGGRVNSNSPPGRGFGLDMRSNFPCFNENDVRLQVLMQRSSFSQQNPRRLSEAGLDFPQQINSYAAIPSRMVDNNHLSSHYQTRRSLISSNNGHWNEGGNGNNDMRLGLNNGYYYSAVGHEDTKFHFPTSPDLYNTTFGI